MDNLSKHIIPNNSRHQQNKLVLLLWTWNIDYGSKSTRKLPSPAPNSYGRFDRLQRAVDPMQSCRARVNDWNYWQRNLTLMSRHLLLFLFQTWCDPKFLTTCLLGFSDQERETETFRHTHRLLWVGSDSLDRFLHDKLYRQQTWVKSHWKCEDTWYGLKFLWVSLDGAVRNLVPEIASLYSLIWDFFGILRQLQK